MNTTRPILLVPLLLLLLGGCGGDDPVTAPATDLDKGENGNGAWVETGTGIFNFDGTFYWECVDEVVHVLVYAPYTWRLVHLPSGETIYHEHWDTENVVGTLEGMETGLIWHREHVVTPLVMVRDQVVHYTLNQVFVCAGDGPTVRVHEVYHRNLDGSGEVVQEWDKFRCWEIH
jgi:hypothetical protein